MQAYLLFHLVFGFGQLLARAFRVSTGTETLFFIFLFNYYTLLIHSILVLSKLKSPIHTKFYIKAYIPTPNNTTKNYPYQSIGSSTLRS